MVVSRNFARRVGVILSIALGAASRADHTERIDRPDWFAIDGADGSIACLAAHDGPIVRGRTGPALPLLGVDPASRGIRHRLAQKWGQMAVIATQSYLARQASS